MWQQQNDVRIFFLICTVRDHWLNNMIVNAHKKTDALQHDNDRGLGLLLDQNTKLK